MWHAASQLIIQCCTIKTKPIKYATHSISPLTVKSTHPGDNISNSAAAWLFPFFFFVLSLQVFLRLLWLCMSQMFDTLIFWIFIALSYSCQSVRPKKQTWAQQIKYSWEKPGYPQPWWARCKQSALLDWEQEVAVAAVRGCGGTLERQLNAGRPRCAEIDVFPVNQ